MYCQNCGTKVDTSKSFCQNCGLRLDENSPITYYNDPNKVVYVQQVNNGEGKTAGVLCALFVPFLISLFIGLMYSNSDSRSNYYSSLFKTYGIMILIVIIIVVIVLAAS